MAIKRMWGSDPLSSREVRRQSTHMRLVGVMGELHSTMTTWMIRLHEECTHIVSDSTK